MELVEVDYDPLPAVSDPLAALEETAPKLHEAVGGNLVHNRQFAYGNTERAFEAAAHTVKLNWRYPRQASTPIETYGAIAHFEQSPDRYTIWSISKPVHSPAIDGARLTDWRQSIELLSAPHSGGSFGIKQGLYPYLVLLAAASRLLECPLKWIEDRLEHLAASSSASDRADEIEPHSMKTAC